MTSTNENKIHGYSIELNRSFNEIFDESVITHDMNDMHKNNKISLHYDITPSNTDIYTSNKNDIVWSEIFKTSVNKSFNNDKTNNEINNSYNNKLNNS